tara:strand:+ start:235 stop:2352 length:2118 start_codon:yes stop_codon:yes gene_type:complete
MITAILIVAAGSIVLFATDLFSKDNKARVQEANLESARLLASEVRTTLLNLTEKMRLIGITSLQKISAEQIEALQKPFFEGEKDLLAELVIHKTGEKIITVGKSFNPSLVQSLQFNEDDIRAIYQENPESSYLYPKEQIFISQLKGQIPVISISVPLITNDLGKVTHAVVAIIQLDRLLRSVKSEGIITSYLVDSKGYLIAHPNQKRVIQKDNVSHLSIVKTLMKGLTNNGQTRFIDPESKIAYLGAFKTVGFANLGIISQVEEDKALAPARKVSKTSTIITGMVAIVAFLVVFFFSLSLTKPLLSLVDATEKVASGEYDIKIKKTTRDEMGDLVTAFNGMTQGLAEREKMKTAFDKFHSKEMTEKVLSGELKLGGERKQATVFFSDVRGFTAMSETMEPEHLVRVLNRYMTKMVSVILEHGGMVDKFIGDAIMAVWGAVDQKSNDVENAVRACLKMRIALDELNNEFIEEGLPILKIGMGLNFGPMISGNIGSDERMEFTVIGDAVNTASRIEALTKAFGTDLLISKDVLNKVEDLFVVEKAHEAMVKGKTEPLTVYKVHGYYEDGKEVLIETPYSVYEAEKSDKVKSVGGEDSQKSSTKEIKSRYQKMTSYTVNAQGIFSESPVYFENPISEKSKEKNKKIQPHPKKSKNHLSAPLYSIVIGSSDGKIKKSPLYLQSQRKEFEERPGLRVNIQKPPESQSQSI